MIRTVQRQATQETTVKSEGVIAGAVLREARRALGLRQDQIAEKLFVDIDTYRSWEHSRRSLTRVAVHRYKALIRGLLDIGAPAELVDALDVAVDVDLAIGRALVSEENPFPPVSRCPLWHELLAWAVIGTVPDAFKVYGVAAAPRMAAADRSTLLRRIRVAVDKPDGSLDMDTLRLLGRVYLGLCPSWCDGTDHHNSNDMTLHTQPDVFVTDARDPSVSLRLALARDDTDGRGEVRVWFEQFSLSLDVASEIARILPQLVTVGVNE